MKNINVIITLVTIYLNLNRAYEVFEDIDKRAKHLDHSFMNVFGNAVPIARQNRTGFNRHHVSDHFIFKLAKLSRQSSPSLLLDTLKNTMEETALGYEDEMLSYNYLHGNISNFHWDHFKSKFNKSYSSVDSETVARSTWLENLKAISEHNRELLAGKHTYSLDLNDFTDLTISGFMKSILRLVKGPLYAEEQIYNKTHPKPHPIPQQGFLYGRPLPKAVDWRSIGYRPRTERQLSCGSCYAFSIAHALQAQLFKVHGDWHDLSVQQIVDCSVRYGNHGCHGGSLRAALRYISKDGLEYEKDYHYHAKIGKCHRSSFARKVRPKRWAMVAAGREDELARAVAFVGPVPVSLDASKLTFQFYRSGIYDDPTCSITTVNHAVLVVGYTKDYWILMNWWGKKWGERGYMRLRRGVNRCGVANIAAYVQL